MSREAYRLAATAEAFIQYFNPMELPSAKEDQWWAVYDALNEFRKSSPAADISLCVRDAAYRETAGCGARLLTDEELAEALR